MSLQKTKSQLVRQLKNQDNKVIALSGNWGTGKTHLWNEVKKESDDEKVMKAFYVSLFGLSSVDQIKRKLCESAIPGVESHGGVFDSLKKLMGTGVKALAQHYKAFAALNDLNIVLMAPILLRSSVIVIDDIERKHERLGIDEVLGFIDEYSKEFNCRFVLVLNDDQLSSKGDQEKLWNTFREKVIDQEIRLTTSSDEAFAIALDLAPSKYAHALKKAAATCGLNNIRILVKVIRVANQILADRDLDDAIQVRVVPSIVLFSAIHYRGLRDGPDFKFALNIGNMDWSEWARDREKEPTPEQKRQDGWRLLMHELGIQGCDEFEGCLVQFLESGLFDSAAIEAVIERYMQEKEALVAREAARQFITRAMWDHRTSEEQLVAEAAQFEASAGVLDPYTVTELHSFLVEMSGGTERADAIVDRWISNFKATAPNPVNDDNPFSKPLHPKIQQVIEQTAEAAHNNTTVVEACMHISRQRGWGIMQEIALQKATAADFEVAIRSIEDIDVLRRFMRQMIDMRLNRETYDAHFGSASERFMEACRAIAYDPASPRLSSLLHLLLDKTAVANELSVLAEPADTPALGAQ